MSLTQSVSLGPVPAEEPCAQCGVKWMTGPRAGKSYPCVASGICETGTGLSAFHVHARRDANLARLQEMRLGGKYFAVSGGAILEL
jgi:hypothetical protein